MISFFASLRAGIVGAALLCVPSLVLAQSFEGELRSGSVAGNPNATGGPATDATLTAMFDRAFCGTNNSSLIRLAGSWNCGAIWSISGSNIYNANAGSVGIGTSSPGTTLDVLGTATFRRGAGNIGGTILIGGGSYQWSLTGNQVSGGDLFLLNPAGGNVLAFPQTGGCMGLALAASTLPTCAWTLDVGSNGGNAGIRINSGNFVAGQGPLLTMKAGTQNTFQMGTDCVIMSSPCTGDLVLQGQNSSRQMHFWQWGGISVDNTATFNPYTMPTTLATAAGGTILTFSSVPAWIVPGTYVSDTTTTAAIPSSVTVVSKTATTVTISSAVVAPGVGLNDTISFNSSFVGGAFNVRTRSSNPYTGGNAISAYTVDDTASNFPTAITALFNAQTAGNRVWGAFLECDLNAAVECAGVEGTIGNTSGAPNVPPVSTVFGPTLPFASALKATCGGALSNANATTYQCSVGLFFPFYNGGGGRAFLYGIYMTEGMAATAGLFINATASLSPTTSAVIKNSGAASNKILVLQTMGAVGAQSAIEVQNNAGALLFAVQTNGQINVTQGGTIQSLSNFSLLDTSGFQMQLASASSPVLTANHKLTLNIQNGDRNLAMSGDLTVSNTLTFAGTNGSTLNVGAGGTLGTAAFVNTGTSGGTVPLLNGSGIVYTNAVTFGVATGAIGIIVNGGAGNGQGSYLSFQENSIAQFIIGGHSAIFGGVDTDHTPILFSTTNLDIYPGSTQRHRFWSGGGLSIGTISDPGLGMIYTNSATYMIRTKTSYTNGGGAASGTLTNAPAAGNPTKWIAIDDNGVTRYIPSW